MDTATVADFYVMPLNMAENRRDSLCYSIEPEEIEAEIVFKK